MDSKFATPNINQYIKSANKYGMRCSNVYSAQNMYCVMMFYKLQ